MMTPAKTSASGMNETTKICQLLNNPYPPPVISGHGSAIARAPQATAAILDMAVACPTSVNDCFVAKPVLSIVEGPVLSIVEGPVLSIVEGPVLSIVEGPVLSIVEG